MQKDLSNAVHERGPDRVSLAGSLSVLAVLLATLAVASYPRVAAGITIGAAATVLVRRWYARLDTPGAPTSSGAPRARSDAGSEHTRTEQREARLANGQG
jgi:hypothetical protein